MPFTNMPHVSLYMSHFLWCKSFDLCNTCKHFKWIVVERIWWLEVQEECLLVDVVSQIITFFPWWSVASRTQLALSCLNHRTCMSLFENIYTIIIIQTAKMTKYQTNWKLKL
jgi:hypothetical protein